MGGGGVPCTKQSGPPLSRAVGGASMGKVPCTTQSVPPPSAPSEARAWAEADCPSPSGPGPRRPAPVGARAWAGEDRPAPGRPPPGWRAWSLVLPCFAGATLLDPLPCSSDSAGVGLACSLRLGGGVSVRRWQFGVSHPRRGRTRGDQRVRCGESLRVTWTPTLAGVAAGGRLGGWDGGSEQIVVTNRPQARRSSFVYRCCRCASAFGGVWGEVEGGNPSCACDVVSMDLGAASGSCTPGQ